MPQAQSPDEISVVQASVQYRRLWRAFLAAGLLGLTFAAPLLTNLELELRSSGEAPFGSKIKQGYAGFLSPVALGVILIGLVLLFFVGKWSPRRMVAGTALLALGAVASIEDDWLLLEDALDWAKWDVTTVGTIITSLIWAVSTLGALAALLALRTLRPAASGPTVLRRLAAFSSLATARAQHRTFRPTRLLWLVVAFLLATAMAMLLQYAIVRFRLDVLGMPPFGGDTFAWQQANPYKATIGIAAELAQVVLTIAIFTLTFRFFWRLVVTDARKFLAAPDYEPIVFLRSFADDASSVISKRLPDRLIGRRRRLEEIAVRALRPLGVAIAIGQPGERLPELGAIRAYYADEEWQAAVLEWMRRAHLIAIVGGASQWTLWELKQVLDRGYTGKLLLLLPPDHNDAARQTRWQALADTAGGTAWEGSMRSLQPAGVLATVLRPNGDILPVRGNGRLQADYEAAVQLATVELFRSAG